MLVKETRSKEHALYASTNEKFPLKGKMIYGKAPGVHKGGFWDAVSDCENVLSTYDIGTFLCMFQ